MPLANVKSANIANIAKKSVNANLEATAHEDSNRPVGCAMVKEAIDYQEKIHQSGLEYLWKEKRAPRRSGEHDTSGVFKRHRQSASYGSREFQMKSIAVCS